MAVLTAPQWADLRGTLQSELTKVRSVRSTYWALALVVVAGLAWSIAVCAGTAAHWARMSPGDRASIDPTQSSVLGVAFLGQLIIVVLGALMITSEYSTQAIRGSLTAMPRRGILFEAKAMVLAAVAVAVAVPASFLAFFVGQSLLHHAHANATLGQHGVLSAVLAAAAYVVLCGLFSFALGTLLRSTAGTITASYGMLFLLPELARGLPSAWYQDAVRWLPGGGQFIGEITSTSGSQAYSPNLSFFPPWGELAILGGYTALLLIAGAVALCRRDA
jgi:ABC-2 type transport system permease protein